MREGQNIWKFARPHFHTYTPAFRGLSLSTGKERDPQVVVNTLGDFYDTHFSEPNFDPSNACHRRYLAIYTQIAYTPNIPLEQITYEEVIKEWKKFLPKKATDSIDTSAFLLKKLPLKYLEIITILFDRCAKKGTFFEASKHAKVVCLSKDDMYPALGKLRPISLLPNIGNGSKG
ncbi:unnamed protein product [Rotaria sp. Silwood1]|nr:unnamed protein product [Rotaria sp. Silwood1]